MAVQPLGGEGTASTGVLSDATNNVDAISNVFIGFISS